MPKEIIVKSSAEAQDLAWWRKQKQLNEQEMAKALAATFNNGALIGSLREATQKAMPYISDPSRAKLFTKIWNTEKHGYRVFLEVGEWEQIKKSVNSLSAEHCSNIIRLYCAIVEEEKGQGAGDMMGLRRDFGRFDPTGKGVKATGDDEKVIWKGGRQRESKVVDGKKQPLTFEETQDLRRKTYDMTDSSLLGLLVKTRSGELKRVGGMASNVMKNDSTVLKLDRVFGLAAGADISGTTTDTLHFMNDFSLALDPIFGLLPIATIVPECHHTLLEVALSLSLNRKVGAATGIDYSVGLYTTLMPKERTRRIAAFNGARNSCNNILKNFEEAKANRLMMIYYKGPGLPGGCFLFDKTQDREVWSLMCSADDNLLQAFRGASSWPTYDEVKGRINLYT